MPTFARSIWKGYLQFSLVTVPVRAYTATVTGGGAISLNQLHDKCHSRIRYKKTCPIHGEVPNDQIVTGYQFEKDQYVVVEPAEIEKLRTKREKAISVEAFVPHDSIEPRYYSGKTYYLLPDGQIGHKPYALLIEAMKQTGRHGFAQVAWTGGRKQIVLLRPIGQVLAMTMLTYAQELRPPADFEGDVPPAKTSADELKLAKNLMDAMAVDEFDINQFRDDYQDKLAQLIRAKVDRKQVIAPPAEGEAPVSAINLMDALKRSVEQAKKGKPAALVAPGTKGKRRRKTA